MKRASQPRRNNQRKPVRARQGPPSDIWRTPGSLPDVQSIDAPQDAAALVRSLGRPPLLGDTDVSPYFERVVERSAAIATALALSVDLIAHDPD